MAHPTQSTSPPVSEELGLLRREIIRALLYFDVFDYPLREEEIARLLPGPEASPLSLGIALSGLARQGCIGTLEGFYFIGEENGRVARRQKGNALAEQKMAKAARYSLIISRFPFVRGVCISGSLSKGYMDARSDIDYFVITEPGRLWLARALVILFKKAFLLNSRKYFCTNYFVDTDSLLIPDRNLFTATELVFLLPAYNHPLYAKLLADNGWVREYFPRFPLREDKGVHPVQVGLLKKGVEWLFRGALGKQMDEWSFGLTTNYWKHKFRGMDAQRFDVNLRSRKNASKHHPQGFQWKTLEKHKAKMRAFEEKFGIDLGMKTEEETRP